MHARSSKFPQSEWALTFICCIIIIALRISRYEVGTKAYAKPFIKWIKSVECAIACHFCLDISPEGLMCFLLNEVVLVWCAIVVVDVGFFNNVYVCILCGWAYSGNYLVVYLSHLAGSKALMWQRKTSWVSWEYIWYTAFAWCGCVCVRC